MASDADVVVIGAGPYGMASATFLRAVGREPVVFGEPMEFWRRNMPAGMLLRSQWEASHIADPTGALTLDRYEADEGVKLERPIPRDDFLRYADWYRRAAVPEIDRRRVELLSRGAGGELVLRLEDGEELRARRVVVAAGLSPFGAVPAPFDALPRDRVAHSSQITDLARFSGQRVLVAGSGQSALESAALLHELGADVELLARAPTVHWLRGARLRASLGRLRPLFYPDTDVGPPGLNQIVARPIVFRRFPRGMREQMAYRSIRPAGAGWLVPRLHDVPFVLGRRVVGVEATNGLVRLSLDDGSFREAEYVLAATGYPVDVAGYHFLDRELVAGLSTHAGYPILTRGLESSQPGVHFVGAPAADSFGPVMRFVSGTGLVGRALSRALGRG